MYQRSEPMRILRILGVVVLGLMISITIAAGQTWEPLTNQPTFNPGVMLLLTDEPSSCTRSQTVSPAQPPTTVRGTSSRPTAPAATSTALGRRSPRSLPVTLHCILVLLCCPTAGSSWKAENTTAPVEAVTRSGQIKAHFTIRSRIRGRLSNPQKVGLPSAMLNP